MIRIALACALCIAFAGVANAQVFISEVVDGTLPGGNPKFVEITNCGDVEYAFAAGDQVAIYFNGEVTPNTTVALDGVVIAAGDSITIASTANNGDVVYFDTYGENPDISTPAFFANGDDVYALEIGGMVHDTYGIIGVDGTGMDWEYIDSYAQSLPNRAPNGGAFDALNWVIPGPNALETGDDLEEIELLRDLTNPGEFDCGTTPAVPALSLGGLVALSAIFGTAGAGVLRRRR
jgi:hypothetical protein